MTEERFPPRVVCAALGIPQPTVQTWANTGLLRNFDGGSTVKGQARRFTLSDVLGLALIKQAGGHERAMADLAPMVADDYIAGVPVRELVLFFDRGGSLLGFAYDANARPLGCVEVQSFIVAEIFENAITAIKAAANATREGFAVVDPSELAAKPDPGQFRVISG